MLQIDENYRPDFLTLEKKYFSCIDNPNAMAAREIAEDMAEYYVNNKIDKIEIITTRFRNMVSYSVDSWPVMPIDGVKDIHERKDKKRDSTKMRMLIRYWQKFLPLPYPY